MRFVYPLWVGRRHWATLMRESEVDGNNWATLWAKSKAEFQIHLIPHPLRFIMLWLLPPFSCNWNITSTTTTTTRTGFLGNNKQETVSRMCQCICTSQYTVIIAISVHHIHIIASAIFNVWFFTFLSSYLNLKYLLLYLKYVFYFKFDMAISLYIGYRVLTFYVR